MSLSIGVRPGAKENPHMSASQKVGDLLAELEHKLATTEAALAQSEREKAGLAEWKEKVSAYIGGASKDALFTIERGAIVDGPERGWAQHTWTSVSPITFVRGSIATVQLRADGAGSLDASGDMDKRLGNEEDFFEIRTTYGSRVFVILDEATHTSLLAWIAGVEPKGKK
jgi:hypothetical protein